MGYNLLEIARGMQVARCVTMNNKRLLVATLLIVLSLLLNSNVLVHQDGLERAEPLQRMTAELLAALNWERELNDLPVLIEEPLLCQAAAAHNEKMFKEQRLAHEFPDYPTLPKRLEAQGLLFVEFCGENIACSDSDIIEQVHERLMASPPHRANILDKRYTHCGIAVIRAGSTYYISQEFAGLPILKETEQAERSIVNGVRRRLKDAGKGEITELSGELWQLRKAAYLTLKGAPASLASKAAGCVVASFVGYDLSALAQQLAQEMNKNKCLALEVGVALGRSGKMEEPRVYYYVQARMCPGANETDQAGMNRK